MNKDEKQQLIDELQKEIGGAPNAFLVEFKGITVPQVTDLRKQIRDSGAGYLVVKNTLALIALKDSPLVELREQFSGPTAVAYTKGDAVALAKTLTRFAKDVPALTFKGAMLDKKLVSASQIETIANLPSKAELVARLLGVLTAPIRGLVTVLSANQRNLAVLLSEIAKKQGGEAESAAPAE